MFGHPTCVAVEQKEQLMNKKLLVIAGGIVLIAALAFSGVALAQAPGRWATPQPGDGSGGTYGPGMMGWRGAMPGGPGMMGAMRAGSYGPMHEAMQTALAEALDLTREQFDERLANGETPYQIAIAQGLTSDEFFQLMQTVRQTAVAQLVADGALTQAQADWMLSHMGRMPPGNFGNCPYYNPTPAPDQP
jgi:hypothetical protein